MKPIQIFLMAFATPDYLSDLGEMDKSLARVAKERRSRLCFAMGDEVFVRLRERTLPPMTWASATSKKAGLILQTLTESLEYPDSWVMYLDADARFIKPPPFRTLLEGAGVDGLNVLAHLFPHPRKGPELLTGTLFFRSCPAARGILSDWAERCENNTGVWDQRHLENVLGTRSDLAPLVGNLGYQWCWIDGGKQPDLSEQVFGPRPADVCIVHTQASRRLKNKEAQPLRKVARRVAAEIDNLPVADGASPVTLRDWADDLTAALLADAAPADRLDWLECDLCGQPAAKPYDVGDACICGGKLKIKEN